MSITYTFTKDCKIPQLRGVTATGGQFCRIDGKFDGVPDAVRFEIKVAGQPVMAAIAGKPELEAALAAHLAAAQAVTDRLASIGWPKYQAASRALGNARGAYDAASEYGYPAREAALMAAAEKALAQVSAEYPQACAYGRAVGYSQAANADKAAAGRQAMEAIEGGADPLQAIAKMNSAWTAAAAKSVENA